MNEINALILSISALVTAFMPLLLARQEKSKATSNPVENSSTTQQASAADEASTYLLRPRAIPTVVFWWMRFIMVMCVCSVVLSFYAASGKPLKILDVLLIAAAVGIFMMASIMNWVGGWINTIGQVIEHNAATKL